MSRYFLALICVLGGMLNGKGQTLNLNDLCTFPSLVSESSGIIALDSNRVLTHNDSGDSSRIFIYNHATCTLEKQVFIRDHLATDIEAITLDDSGYVYVADMGNNLGNRTNLCILKLRLQEIKTQDTVDAEKIQFSYGDQVSFSSSSHNFDAESFVHHHDSLFIFSKNHGVAGTYSKRYAVPDLPGTYVPMPLDSIALSSWVTDAAIDRAHEHFVLLSEQKLYIFRMHDDLVNFSDLLATLSFTFLSQKEGVSFWGEDSILVTDEYVFGTGGKLYLADLSQWVSVASVQNKQPVKCPISYQGHELMAENTTTEEVHCQVIDLQGKVLLGCTIKPGEIFRYQPVCHGLLRLSTTEQEQVFKF